MADNFDVTAGTGTTIRAVEKSSKKHQVVVLDVGGSGAESLTAGHVPVRIGPTDPISDLPVFVDFAHHQVHEGEAHIYVNLTASLASGSNKDFRVNVPVGMDSVLTCPHMVIEVVTSGEAEVYIYEGMTYTGGNGGSLRTSYNRNRNSATAAGATIYEDTVPATTGTLLWVGLTGSGNKAGGEDRANVEFLLAPGDYLYRVTSRAAGCKVVVRFEWYEDLGV